MLHHGGNPLCRIDNLRRVWKIPLPGSLRQSDGLTDPIRESPARHGPKVASSALLSRRCGELCSDSITGGAR